MRTKLTKTIFVLLLIGAVFAVWYFKFNSSGKAIELTKEIQPVIGSIESIISTTGTVLPKNRLEVKPPVNGRIEEILVKEGEKVKTGQTIAWMSSTERAAMLDAARGQGEESLRYWKEVYKAIPLSSPIDGEVIVATTQPGQTVTTSDAVIVLSDHLIARAQVDETDIGKIKLGQNATIILDAYPDTKIKAKVEHIYYESQTVNNVTIYNADLLPEEVPAFFRSGMNTTIDFISQSKNDVLLLPIEAVHKIKDENFVFVKKDGVQEPVKQPVTLGISDDKNVEIVSGISSSDEVIVKEKKFALPTASVGSSPFTPFGQKKQPQKK